MNLKKVDFPLIGIAGRTTYPSGAIRLPVVMGESWKALRTKIIFIIVDALTSCNSILGCTNLNPNKIVALTCHQKMKFSTPHGIEEVKNDQHTSRRFYVNALRRCNHKETLFIQTNKDP